MNLIWEFETFQISVREIPELKTFQRKTKDCRALESMLESCIVFFNNNLWIDLALTKNKMWKLYSLYNGEGSILVIVNFDFSLVYGFEAFSLI